MVHARMEADIGLFDIQGCELQHGLLHDYMVILFYHDADRIYNDLTGKFLMLCPWKMILEGIRE